MLVSQIIAISLVFIGAFFLSTALNPAIKTRKIVPPELQKKWLVIIYLMIFFIAGYLFFDLILLLHLSFPVNLVTGSVFFFGAIFVLIVITLAKKTILTIDETKNSVALLNETLEQRVKERTKVLQHSQQTLQTILESMPYGVVIISKDKKIKTLNDAALSLMNYDSENELIGQICNHTLCPSEEGKCPILDLNQEVDRSERFLIKKNGQRVPILKTVVPVEIDNTEVLLEVFVDITERKKTEEQIRFLAYYDSLTGLPNRTFCKELLTRTLNDAQRYNKIVAILFIDLDSFKHINDTLGHDVGDQLLQGVSERLVQSVRKCDCVGRCDEFDTKNSVSRLGGDEFIVIISEMVQVLNALVIARRIIESLSQPFQLNGHEVFITTSIGIASYPSDGKDVETLFKNADVAMYYAKEHGKNSWQFYTESMNTASYERLTLTNELHRAIERNELVLYYQPKVNLNTKTIIGLEALIRWKHPVKGLVSPVEFISLAEETGLIIPIGDWVLRTACVQNRMFQTEGFESIPVSINISRHQFERQNFIGNIIKTLQESEFAAHLLELEITESTIMQNPEKTTAMLRDIKSLGIKVSIDDFGKGYSSLDHLRWLPLDALKIDRSFVINILSKQEDAAITQAIIALAHNLKLKVVAEGVETEEQCNLLRSLGCNEAQGFYFCEPLPANELILFYIKK